MNSVLESPFSSALTFAASTVLYTSIQIFIPDLWAQFYYHPTLNPFGLPTLLSLFLTLAWLIVVLFIATLDDIRRCLPPAEAIPYTFSLLAILGTLYLLFSIAVIHYIHFYISHILYLIL